jgi:hypothetical protein
METEEEDLCGAAILAFHSLAELAERLETGGAGEKVVVSEGVSRLAEKAAAFVARNPAPPLQPNPLARLAIEVAHLRELESANVEDRKGRASWLAGHLHGLSSLSAMRLDWLLEKRQWEAEAEARVLEAQADAAAARKDYEGERRLRAKAEKERDKAKEARDVWREVADGRMVATLAAAQGAERAALRTEAAVKGRAKTDTLDADLVEAFKAFDAAQKEQAGPQAEIAAGVIADAKEEGRMICCGTRKFLEWWRGWVKVGSPDAEQYAEMHRERGRRPV